MQLISKKILAMTLFLGCNELGVAGINSTVISIEWTWPCLVENSTW
jgi:hypothetical protein